MIFDDILFEIAALCCNDETFTEIFEPCRLSEAELMKESTGFAINDSLILTAGHGVPRTPDSLVLYRGLREFKRNEAKYKWAKVIWHGGDSIDAALLQAQSPLSRSPISLVGYEKSMESVKFDACGFPAGAKIKFGELKDQCDSKQFTGKFLPGEGVKGGGNIFRIDNAPETIPEIQGASGSPIIIDRVLFGLFCRIPDPTEPEKAQAISVQQLTADAGFRKAANLDLPEEFTKLRAEIEDYIAGSRQVKAVFCRDLGLPDTIKAGDLVNCLLQLNPFPFLELLRKMKPQEFDDCDKDVCRALMIRVLPILFSGMALYVPYQQGDGYQIYQASVEIPATAELLMAGLEKRVATYRNRGDSSELIGQLAIESSPSVIMKRNNQNPTSADILQHIAEKVTTGTRHAGKRDKVPGAKLVLEARFKHDSERPHYYVLLSGHHDDNLMVAREIADQFNNYVRVILLCEEDSNEGHPEEERWMTWFEETFSEVQSFGRD